VQQPTLAYHLHPAQHEYVHAHHHAQHVHQPNQHQGQLESDAGQTPLAQANRDHLEAEIEQEKEWQGVNVCEASSEEQQSLQTLAAVAALGKRKLRRGIDGKFEQKSNIHARKHGRFANAYGISQHSLTEQAIRPLMRFCQDTAAEYLKVSTNTLSKACARLNIKWPRRPEIPTTVSEPDLCVHNDRLRRVYVLLGVIDGSDLFTGATEDAESQEEEARPDPAKHHAPALL